MARSDAKTVQEYLNELPPERRETLSRVRDVVLSNLPSGYAESMNWVMISYEVLVCPPKTEDGVPFAHLTYPYANEIVPVDLADTSHGT